MSIQIKKNDPIIKMITQMLINLPSPSNISYMWNFGSILGLCLVIQIISGLFMSMHYSTDMQSSFLSIIHISKDVNYGWIMRFIHMNGASMFFIFIYLHLSRNIYYNLFNSTMVWISGVTIILITMGSAFLGYVLPWGQMSFWGATVITNLTSAIPYIGTSIVTWLWGGFSVSNPTLNRFFSLHFILPLVLVMLVLIHLIFLHEKGSSNPLGMNSNMDKIPFHPYFSYKDTLGFSIPLSIMMILSLINPFILGDPENFNEANPMSTPLHIQPEWYFLFAYAILRSIPNKLGGVIALLASLLIFYISPFISSKNKISSFLPIKKMMFWILVSTFILLTWIGANPVEYPFIFIGQTLSIAYFLMVLKISYF